MKDKYNWNENPSIILILHILILVFGILNFNYQFLIYSKEKQSQLVEIEISQVKTSIEDLQEGSNFQNSEFFKQKQIRNQGYKKVGEDIIDTSIVEPVLTNFENNRNYIPAPVSQNNSQIDKWMDCLFYGIDRIQENITFCRF